MSTKTLRYDLSRYKGLSIKSVTIKVTTGHDEQIAVDAARARNLQGAYFDELVRQSVVEYDGTKPVYPFPEYNEWNKKTRDVVKRLFKQVNAVDTLDQKKLEAALTGEPDGDLTMFDFSELPGVDVKSVSIREVTGLDEEKAIRSTVGGDVTFEDAIVKLSVAKVDGSDTPADLDTLALNTRTLTLIKAAYAIVNSTMDLPDVLEAEAE